MEWDLYKDEDGDWGYVGESTKYFIVKGKTKNNERNGVWTFSIEKTRRGRLYRTTGKVNEHFRMERVIWKGKYKNGKKQGLWKSVYSNGKKRSEGTYIDDLKNGLWIEGCWDEDDNNYQTKCEHEEGNYKDSKREGLWTKFYTDECGKHKVSEGYYKNGIEDGKWIFYDWRMSNDTTKNNEGNYKDGKRDGVWTYYKGDCDDNVIHHTETYKDDVLIDENKGG